MKRKVLLLYSGISLVLLLLLGCAIKFFPTAIGYRLLRSGVVWPLRLAEAVWFVLLVVWAVWVIKKWKDHTK